MLYLCVDLREGVIENVITAFTAISYNDIWSFDSLQHLTSKQRKNTVGHAQTNVTQCTGFIYHKPKISSLKQTICLPQLRQKLFSLLNDNSPL